MSNLSTEKLNQLNRRNKGHGGSTYSNFIAGRPQATLLFLFFGDFKGGVLLFMVILVIYNHANRFS